MVQRRNKREMLQEANGYLAAAHEARVAGRHLEGVESARSALALAEVLGDRRLKAAAFSVLALNEFRLSDSELAIEHCLQAMPLLKRDRYAAERTQVLCTLVMAYNDLGLFTEALDHATRAMDSARITGDPSLMSWAFNRAGVTYQELGDPARGEALMLQALSLAREIGGGEEVFGALNNLCSNLLYAVKSQSGDARHVTLMRALEYGNEALELATTPGNAHREAICRVNLSMATSGLDRFEDALAHLVRVEALAEANGYRGMTLTALVNRAEVERRRGDIDDAIRLLGDALATVRATDDHAMLREIHAGLYECHKSRGDIAEALTHHEALMPLELEAVRQRADRQARLMLNRLEVELAQSAAERARLDAEVQRLKATKLESEKRLLEVQALELGRHALEDQLTGLANRRRVDHDLPAHLAAAREGRIALSVAAVDLDNFKLVNDRYGHTVGDDVLRAVARVLLENTRTSDLLARMGGEEFLILFVATPLGIATDICERLRHAVETFDWDGIAAGLQVTISIGLCDALNSEDMRGLLERADASLYTAKRAGRNRVEVGSG
jgi:diguanylate cyclase (GGDEF)-like protein